MQSRRHEDYASQSSFGRSRRNADLDADSYLMMSPRSKRSWSPRRMEGSSYSQRGLSGRRSASLERRRALNEGSRRIRSRSPSHMEARRGGSFYNDDLEVDRDFLAPERRARYEFFDRMDGKHDHVDSPLRNEFGYGHGSSRTAIMDNKFEGRRLDSRMGEIESRKSAVTGLYRSTGDMGPTSKTESGGDLASVSLKIGLGQLGKERATYPDVRDSYSFDKFIATKQYRDEETNMAHLRDTSYSNLTASRSNKSMGATHFKDYARTSPRKSGVDHYAYRDSIPLPRDNHPANTPEPLSHSRYEQRQHLDIGRDPEPDVNEDMVRYRRDACSPLRTGHLDSLRLQPQLRERVGSLYPSDDIYDKMNLHERVDYGDRDMFKSTLLDHVPQRAETSDFARRNMNNRSSLDHLPLEKLTTTTNTGLSRSPAERRERAQYLDPASVHSRLGRKIPREQEMPYMGMVQDREERIRLGYDSKRDVDTGSQKERMSSPPGYLYDTERLRLPERTNKMEDHDFSPYGSSSRFLKRKYTTDDEENRITSRAMSRLDTINRRPHHEFDDDEWIEDVRGSNFTKRRVHTHGFSRRVDNDYDEADPMSEEWFSNDPEEFMPNHHMKSYKYEDKYAKGHPRSGGRGGYNSYHSNRRHVLPKWKNVSIRSENDKELDMYSSGEIKQYEDWASCAKSEPREDSEEFKQLVHEYFLSFTKKLNDTTGVQRRYMEQGRAGSLFCIVCGRSLSKEFLDTQRLAMHAYMSHKVGLRAQHMGLHKAICVMLGWNSAIPAETLRWYPEPLSSTEALAQKDDLVIWPPVIVVHNVSITNNDSNGQGPTTIEALGQFLRGKGLTGGKIRLGKPANCSIMLVKFLGTFSALQEAKKIHQYFAKNKHGRKDLEQITSSKGKNKDGDESGEGGDGNGDKEAERVLYGYMGIAEDLEKVDFDTKKKCSIKSKKEIQDLADAPVKPE